MADRGTQSEDAIGGGTVTSWWDEKEGIIRNKWVGDFNEDDARKAILDVIKVQNSRPGKILTLNDMTEAGAASSVARRFFIELMNSEKAAKRAFFGMKTVTRVQISFMVHFSTMANAEFFSNEEEALKWLKR